MTEKLLFPELRFYDNGHIYELNDVPIPSVTTIMKPISEFEYGSINESTLNVAASKGTAVHNSIENYIKYQFEDCDPEYLGYFKAFKEWWEINKPELVGSEIRAYHKTMRYAGTIDLLAVIKGKLTLVDFKTTASIMTKLCRVQLEAYKSELTSHGVEIERKVSLHMRKDGTWVAEKYLVNDIEAWKLFTQLSSFYWAKVGIKKAYEAM